MCAINTSRVTCVVQGDAPPAGAKLQAIEAGLQLLLQLLQAGRPGVDGSAPSRRLFMLDALPCLLRCSALDLVPEEPGMVPPGARSLRHRLAKVAYLRAPWMHGYVLCVLGSATAGIRTPTSQVMAPCLRLALGLVVQLPHSAQVRQQAAAFVDAHSAALVRVLQDASSLGVR